MLQNGKHRRQTVNTTTTQLSSVKHNDSTFFTLFSNGGLEQCQLSPWCPNKRIVQHQPAFFTVNVPPYSPFLNPIEEFFSVWRWKVDGRNSYTRVNHLQAMELACGDIGVECFQGWIQHTRGFSPCFSLFFFDSTTLGWL